MKKIILAFLFVFSLASNMSVINPTWSIIDCVNNYELINKDKQKYLDILKSAEKVIKLKNSFIKEDVYDKVFKSGVWDKMIEKVKKLYNKTHDKTLKEIIFYMEKIKKEAKKQNFAIA